MVFGIPLLISLALQWVFPLSLSQGILGQAIIPAGAILIIAGIGFIVLARRELAHYGQPTDPGRPTGKLVNTGVFSISRNPLYLGIVIALSGVALALNILWILVLLIPAIVACHHVLIAPEEKYLGKKFGKEYQVYVASVRRWFGRK